MSDRLENGKNIVFGRSECDHCKKELTPLELIPVLSFVLQKGRCKSCKEKLSWTYPLSEVLTGVVFTSVFVWLGVYKSSGLLSWVTFFYYVVISSILVVIFLSDLKYMIVPDTVVLPGIVLALGFNIFSVVHYAFSLYAQLQADTFGKYLIKAGFWNGHVKLSLWTFGQNILGALGIALFFVLLIIITKDRGMGGGDVKLGFLIGLIAGFPNGILAIFSAFLLGAVVSIFLVLMKRKTVKEIIPFGPFLIAGCYYALFFGASTIEWYLRIL